MATGVNTSLPALMSASETSWPAVTLTPLSCSVPATGSAVILTAVSALTGESAESVKPKSAAVKMYAVSSSVVTVLFVPTGASLTDVTFTLMVRGVASRSMPPFAVPPSSCTWKVNDAYPTPLALAAGVNFRLPALMSANETNWPAITFTPLSCSVPAPGSAVILTAANALTGASDGSVKPKSAAVNV